MADSPETTPTAEPYDPDKRTTLHPLPFEDAVRALLGVRGDRDDDGD